MTNNAFDRDVWNCFTSVSLIDSFLIALYSSIECWWSTKVKLRAWYVKWFLMTMWSTFRWYDWLMLLHNKMNSSQLWIIGIRMWAYEANAYYMYYVLSYVLQTPRIVFFWTGLFCTQKNGWCFSIILCEVASRKSLRALVPTGGISRTLASTVERHIQHYADWLSCLMHYVEYKEISAPIVINFVRP